MAGEFVAAYGREPLWHGHPRKGTKGLPTRRTGAWDGVDNSNRIGTRSRDRSKMLLGRMGKMPMPLIKAYRDRWGSWYTLGEMVGGG